MKKLWLLAMLIAPLAFAGPKVRLETNHGNIVVELAAKQAPQTVKNFLRYVADGSYDGSLFHRVIQDFVVQGGGYNQQFQQLPTYEPLINESLGGLPNKRGTIAMARTQAVDSATRQFYFNLVDNNNLNASGSAGYTVFGQVVQGMMCWTSWRRCRPAIARSCVPRMCRPAPLFLSGWCCWLKPRQAGKRANNPRHWFGITTPVVPA